MQKQKTIIIGAGLTGLAAAHELIRHKHDFIILEQSGRLGGRVGSEIVDGFTLDHGFQVILDNYPELRSQIDVESLHLAAFARGACIIQGQNSIFLGRIREILKCLRLGLLSPSDLLAFCRLFLRIYRQPVDRLLNQSQEPVHKTLRHLGFSNRLIQGFWSPFLGGVFLDETLNCSSGMFLFLIANLWQGHACLPTGGMQSVVNQLAQGVSGDRLRMNCKVKKVESHRVQLEDGRYIEAENILICLDLQSAHRVLGVVPPPPGRGCTTLYYASSRNPAPHKYLILNGDRDHYLNHLAIPSNIQPGYAPAGYSLLAATCIGTSTWGESVDLDAEVRQKLKQWFNDLPTDLRLLKSVRIPDAHPRNYPDRYAIPGKGFDVMPGVFIAGDYLESPSVHSALKMGRVAAFHLVESSKKSRLM